MTSAIDVRRNRSQTAAKKTFTISFQKKINNKLRSTAGKNRQYPDDCGVWDTSKGRSVKSHFVLEENNSVKYLTLRDGVYCSEKPISGKKVYKKIDPQPSAEKVIILSRYYTTLKRSNDYKRRVSRLESPANTQTSYSIVEYFGKYPDEVAPHGNSKHQNNMYTRTNPQILEEIARLSEGMNPRDVYKAMVLEDSFDAPKDFKQVRNVKYQQSTKQNKNKIGIKNNVADEVLDCISMFDSNEFVQQCS